VCRAWRRNVDETVPLLDLSGCDHQFNPVDFFVMQNFRVRGIFVNFSDIAGAVHLPYLRRLRCSWADNLGVEELADTADLRAMHRLESVKLDFSRCQRLRDASGLVIALEGLDSLRELEVSFAGCRMLGSIDRLLGGVARLPQVERLAINWSYCNQLAHIREVASALKELTRLRHLALDFSFLQLLEEVDCLGETLQGLSHLQHLEISLAGCRKMRSVAALGDALRDLPELQHLHLNLYGCLHLRDADIAALGSGLARLPQLRHLFLCIAGCSQVVDISAIGEGLKALGCLRHVELSFAGCIALQNVSSSLCGGIGCLQEVRHLSLNFFDCRRLADVAVLGASLKNLKRLTHLHINFASCSDVRDISSLSPGIGDNVRKLTLSFAGCSLHNLAALGKRLATLRLLEHLSLDFSYCKISLRDDISAVLHSLRRLPQLTNLELDMSFVGCVVPQEGDVQTIAAVRKGIDDLEASGEHCVVRTLQLRPSSLGKRMMQSIINIISGGS
jgi:hypothetical protein